MAADDALNTLPLTAQSDTPSEAGGLMGVTAPRAGVLH